MKLKKHSLIPWLLMAPSLVLLWHFRSLIMECIETGEFLILFGLLGMTVGVYWMAVYVVLWNYLICESGRKRAARRLTEEGFHYNYCLSDTGMAYAFWINEKEGKVAIWNRQEPFALHKTEAGRITKVTVVDKGNEALMGKLTLKLDADGNAISLVLFHAADHMVLRTSRKASAALSQANAICASLKRAGAEVL